MTKGKVGPEARFVHTIVLRVAHNWGHFTKLLSTDCRKNKTKINATANQDGGEFHKETLETELIHENFVKGEKTRVIRERLGLVQFSCVLLR